MEFRLRRGRAGALLAVLGLLLVYSRSEGGRWVAAPLGIAAFTRPALSQRRSFVSMTRAIPLKDYNLKARNPFDVHVYFDDDESRKAAIALRARMQEAFPWMRFYRVHDRCIGPHPSPMWEADFARRSNADRWDEVVSWLEKERGSLSVTEAPGAQQRVLGLYNFPSWEFVTK